jgi:outer membrane usher protein
VGLGRHTTGNTQFQRSEGRDQTIAQIRRPLTLSNGYGYSIQTDTLSGQELAILQYQSSYGRYEVSVDSARTADWTYNVAGGLLFFGDSIRPTRALEEGFALVRTGVPGVQVFASNQPIGRTGRGGDLLITNLLPHYRNELRINDQDVPLDYEVTGTSITIVPPTRGGVVASFPVKRLRSFTGKVEFKIIGEPYTPGLGEVVVRRNGDPLTVSLGRNGEFYIEDLDPGKYQARLHIGKVHCDFALDLPDRETALTDLGVVPCAL